MVEKKISQTGSITTRYDTCISQVIYLLSIEISMSRHVISRDTLPK